MNSSLVLCGLLSVVSAVGAEVRGEAVVLLHGLCRSERSMAGLGEWLEGQGYLVENVGYDSRKGEIEGMAEAVVGGVLERESLRDLRRVHFVTHSMGGILVRQYFSRHEEARLGRVVMLGPPNRGSEVVDRLSGWRLFKWVNGPAGGQLGTGAESVPRGLGPVRFECGVIAGSWSWNPWYSGMLPGSDDGKVSVSSTSVAGMQDHCVLPVSHTHMMRRSSVRREILHFLREGRFTEGVSLGGRESP